MVPTSRQQVTEDTRALLTDQLEPGHQGQRGLDVTRVVEAGGFREQPG